MTITQLPDEKTDSTEPGAGTLQPNPTEPPF